MFCILLYLKTCRLSICIQLFIYLEPWLCSYAKIKNNEGYLITIYKKISQARMRAIYYLLLFLIFLHLSDPNPNHQLDRAWGLICHYIQENKSGFKFTHELYVSPKVSVMFYAYTPVILALLVIVSAGRAEKYQWWKVPGCTYLFGPMCTYKFYAEYPINIVVVSYTFNLRRSAAPPFATR